MKAMILAAGRGERMRPLTDRTPKPLLKVGGKALIVWHLERLAQAGFKEIVINHAYLGAQIEASLGNGANWGVSIAYSSENTALETAGGIAHAMHLLGKQPFLVVNGDVYADYDFGRLIKVINDMQLDAVPDAKLASKKLAHLVMVDNPPQHIEGDFSFQNEIQDEMQNGAYLMQDQGAPKLTFSGIGVYQPSLFDHITQGEAAKLAPILRLAMDKHQVTGEHFKGVWFDIGTPERLQMLDTMLKNG